MGNDEWDKEENMREGLGITVIHHTKGSLLILEIKISEEGKRKQWKLVEKSLIVKLLSWKLSLHSMEPKLEEDYHRARREGPWLIADHYLTVREWKVNFNPMTEVLEDVLVWVYLSDLPLKCYEEEVLQIIGDQIGKTVKVDTTTSFESRGKFARLRVQVDLMTPLLPHFIMEGNEFKVEYEGLYLLCFHCGRYGHMERDCKEKSRGHEEKEWEGKGKYGGNKRSDFMGPSQKQRGGRRFGSGNKAIEGEMELEDQLALVSTG
ncbi:uncharacterized protein LOC114718372 [Neltuma alba]|uniref:uncharacterized protein LOC114718372 n=1 Tax=Neltuma alba TaxID=207710 RepID=UPI0010A53FE8|nr:uncharacterized protein LOC114718372 [Prosopis alba]